jgi:hypothetical protein
MTKPKELQFKIGSRVMHKPAVMMGSRGALPPRLRVGTIQQIEYRSNKRGSKMPWLFIKWDGSNRSEWHMTMRIALAPDQHAIDRIVANEREKVN